MKLCRQFTQRSPNFAVRCLLAGILLGANAAFAVAEAAAASSLDTPFAWASSAQAQRPWTYWWWMGSAVDRTNVMRELQRYRDAGLGGVHIIPIYGAKGFENKFTDYLSPRWMEILRYTVDQAQQLGLGVDMTTGSGWCFGGPRVTDEDANALVTVRTFSLAAGQRLSERFDPKKVEVLAAFSPEGRSLELTTEPDGTVAWSPQSGTWRVYAVSQRPSGQKVKRAGPGGQGHMLNLLYPDAMRRYLQWFDEAFANYSGPRPRAMYHDSYEYRSDWAPDLFAAFAKRRGYRLQDHLPALFDNDKTEYAARVKSDYRETVSDIMIEETLPLWVDWSHRHKFLTRNEAHGSPGNWLDLYALADIPETEMFAKDRSKLVSKFASSAAHLTGKPWVAAETGTWLKEHFTETLADMKYLLDDLFLSGVNHVVYHGTCYSPDEAPWPGWLFYASFEMNPRNPIWRDVPTLNAYAARCQAVLQAGLPDNDILLYWLIHDLWHDPAGKVRNLTVHARDWFEQQPIGRAADRLWKAGYAFDYVSDRQLAAAKSAPGQIEMPGARYRAIVLPATTHLPLPTARRLVELAEAGATVIFEQQLPADVPGWRNFEQRRAELAQLFGRIRLAPEADAPPDQRLLKGIVGKGQVLVGDLRDALEAAKVPREPMFDVPGLMCLRRQMAAGVTYFIANRSDREAFSGWLPLARAMKAVVVTDPLTGRSGRANLRQLRSGLAEVQLAFAPGQSLILSCPQEEGEAGPKWDSWKPAGPAVELGATWSVQFIQGGPELPAAIQTNRLGSWTELGDTNAQRFAGSARYTARFDAPNPHSGEWQLDLGRVCQSARVRLNGQDLGTVWVPPSRLAAGSLKAKDNLLEIEVTSTAANRIRDLDQRNVTWKNFYDINFVNIDYKPFNAAEWPLADAGLLGPVTLTPLIREGASDASLLRDEWVDPDTGHRVRRLSRVPGSSTSFYFHQNPFTSEGDRMVFENSLPGTGRRLFVLDLARLKADPLTEPGVGSAVVGRRSRRVYYQRQGALYATHLDSLETRRIAQLPPRGGFSTINADETMAAGTITEPAAAPGRRPGSRSFEEIFEARIPHTLYTLDFSTGKTNLFYRESAWLNHLQFSPTDPGLLMFCHEGPWHKLDRIWHTRTDGTGLRLLHKRSIPMEIAGHEFWAVDGKAVWFDLQMPRGETFYLAGVDLADGKEVRYSVGRDQWSVHFNISRDGKLFAGDGGAPNMVARASNGQWLWLFTPGPDGALRAERLVNMAGHDYRLEPNVQFTPDAKWIVFRGNFDGSPQVYAVEVKRGA